MRREDAFKNTKLNQEDSYTSEVPRGSNTLKSSYGDLLGQITARISAQQKYTPSQAS